MAVDFTAHNVRLDDGTHTKPDAEYSMEAHPWFVSARRILETVFPGDKKHLRIADLGCLEGGYAVEFARMGFQVLGIEVRDVNIEACNYVKSKTSLSKLEFVKDDAFNIAKYGRFDAIFCCGLLYHLDSPRHFLETLASVTTKLLILQTHFSTDTLSTRLLTPLPALARSVLTKVLNVTPDKFGLSRIRKNEGLPGRWFTEFPDDDSLKRRETAKWSSWDNRRSFWIQREYLLQVLYEVGFDLVMEQFDTFGPDIAENLIRGYYRINDRGTFVGIKTQNAPGRSTVG